MTTSSNRENSLLFVGLNTIDLQFLVSDFPAPNTKTKAKENRIFAGGPAVNAAIAAAHLGGEVDLLTPIGEHTLTGFIVDDIRRRNVCIIDPIAGEPSRPVFASIITTEQSGDRTIFSYHPERRIDMTDRPAFDVRKYRLALFDGFFPEMAVPIARQCREEGVVTVLDGGSWKPWLADLLPYIDIAVCSDDFTVPEGDRPDDVFAHLHAQGVDRAAITRGHRTILFSSGRGTGEIPIEPIAAVDTLGAGDVFHGAFAFYAAEGRAFEKALEMASKVAAHSCLTLGTRDWMKKPA